MSSGPGATPSGIPDRREESPKVRLLARFRVRSTPAASTRSRCDAGRVSSSVTGRPRRSSRTSITPGSSRRFGRQGNVAFGKPVQQRGFARVGDTDNRHLKTIPQPLGHVAAGNSDEVPPEERRSATAPRASHRPAILICEVDRSLPSALPQPAEGWPATPRPFDRSRRRTPHGLPPLGLGFGVDQVCQSFDLRKVQPPVFGGATCELTRFGRTQAGCAERADKTAFTTAWLPWQWTSTTASPVKLASGAKASTSTSSIRSPSRQNRRSPAVRTAGKRPVRRSAALQASGPETRTTASPALPRAESKGKDRLHARLTRSSSRRNRCSSWSASASRSGTRWHRLCHRVQDPAQDIHLLQVSLVDQKIFLPRAGLQDVHRGNTRLSATLRSSTISLLPVPLNSSKSPRPSGCRCRSAPWR